MTTPRKTRPIPDILAELDRRQLDELVNQLADRYADVYDRLQLLGASQADRIGALRKVVAGIKRRRAFVDYRGSFELAGELESLATDIHEANLPAADTLDLAARFLGTVDASVMRCDDSAGTVGSAYSETGVTVFVEAASAAGQPDRTLDLVMDILDHDSNQVCWGLLDRAAEYLDRQAMVELADRYEERARKIVHLERYFCPNRRSAQVLARALGDADRFARLARERDDSLVWTDALELGRLYLAEDRADEALAILAAMDPTRSGEDERSELLLAVHTALGDVESAREEAWRWFRRTRSPGVLDHLVSLVGEEERDRVVAGEVAEIEVDEQLRFDSLRFLESLGDLARVARYVEIRHAQLDGRHYDLLAPLARKLDDGGQARVASAVYRALLVAILDSARTKAYGHGARYLRRLDELAAAVNGWGPLDDHATFKGWLMEAHGRKRSFWRKYGGDQP